MTETAQKPQQMITLQNPVEQHYEAFIFGNAVNREDMVQQAYRRDGIAGDFVVEPDSNKGQHVVICGAGPTLRDHAAEYCHSADQVWGCNSALTYLADQGYRVTHGFTVDQTPHMMAEWSSVPQAKYLLASSVHPFLTELLMRHDREIAFFHNYVGVKKPPVRYDGRMMEYEDWMYAGLYPSTVRAGSGLNAVTRAIDVAEFMGFSRITVLGADCALRVKKPAPKGVEPGSPEHLDWLRESVEMHADGGNALASEATAMTLGGEIDGRRWESKPDMMISARFLVEMKRRLKDRLELIGDTLPNAMMTQTREFLDRMPTLMSPDGKPIQFPPWDEEASAA